MSTQLDAMMTDWVPRIPGATGVVLMSEDGLVRAHSSSLPDETAQSLAAAMTGVRACTAQIGKTAGTGALSVAVLDMTEGWVFVTNAAARTLLGVVATRAAHPAEVSDHMQDLARRIADHLVTAPRSVPAARMP